MEKFYQKQRDANQAKYGTGKVKAAQAGLPTPAEQAKFDELVRQAMAAQGQPA